MSRSRVKFPSDERSVRLGYEKKYRSKNRDRYNAMNRARASLPENKENKMKYMAKYRSGIRKILREKYLVYYAKNKAKILALMSEKRKERKRSDPNYKLECLLRSRLSRALKSQRSQKSFKTLDLIGCSVDFLRSHLESKFRDGMSWENHSFRGWHIDHIKPISVFDLSDKEQQKLCFHYTNLQPLWHEENLSKNDSWNPEEISRNAA
jgi:hypothetical protein